MSNRELFAWVLFALTLWVVRELLLGLWAWRKARRLDHILKIEHTRAQFAVIRNDLMRLAVEKEGAVNPNSATFKLLYFVNTVFMRSPDHYRELSQALQVAVLSNQHVQADPVLIRESKTWTQEERQLMIHTADAMQNILIDYSLLFRLFFFVARKRWLVDRASERLDRLAMKVIGIIEKRNPDVSQIRKAQNVMYRMAA